jgi:hypothetical protein
LIPPSVSREFVLRSIGVQAVALMAAMGIVSFDRLLRILICPESPMTHNPAAGLLIGSGIANFWLSLAFFAGVNFRLYARRNLRRGKCYVILVLSGLILTQAFSCYLAFNRP